MTWILITISAYFFLALASLADRYLLAGPLPSPGVYAFFVGIAGILALVLVPFGFLMPSWANAVLSLGAGAVWIVAIFLLFRAISRSGISRVIPAVGAFVPLFSLLFAFLFSPGQVEFNIYYIISFALFVSGGFLIVLEKDRQVNFKTLFDSFLTGLAFGFGFFLMKTVYTKMSFISGFVLMRAGGFLVALFLLISLETRKTVFVEKSIKQKNVSLPFLLGQLSGGMGFVLQNYAVSLARMSQIPLINALEGIRYAFLLAFVAVLNKKWPHLLKEKMSKGELYRRAFAVLLICSGIALISLK